MSDQFGPSSDYIRQHRKNFLKFLSDPVIRDIVMQMKSTLYSLLHQHAAAADFNQIAQLIGDHESIIVHALQREDWPLAVKTLEERNEPHLFYKYSSALIPHVAGILCKAWAKCASINAEELLPVMASATTKSIECRRAVLNYLQGTRFNFGFIRRHNCGCTSFCYVVNLRLHDKKGEELHNCGYT